MDIASVYYLGVTILLFVIFAAIVARTYSAKRKESGERPKYRMMDEEPPKGAEGHRKSGEEGPKSEEKQQKTDGEQPKTDGQRRNTHVR